MVKIPETKKHDLTMNITSMIDVIFILLIFFMVSTQFKKNSLPLELPECEDTTQAVDNTVTLSVTKDCIQIDGEEVPLEHLEQKLYHLKNEKPEMNISIECDKKLEFETLVQILAKIQKAGISSIGIVHETLDN